MQARATALLQAAALGIYNSQPFSLSAIVQPAATAGPPPLAGTGEPSPCTAPQVQAPRRWPAGRTAQFPHDVSSRWLCHVKDPAAAAAPAPHTHGKAATGARQYGRQARQDTEPAGQYTHHIDLLDDLGRAHQQGGAGVGDSLQAQQARQQGKLGRKRGGEIQQQGSSACKHSMHDSGEEVHEGPPKTQKVRPMR